jgi:hypothetical protein
MPNAVYADALIPFFYAETVKRRRLYASPPGVARPVGLKQDEIFRARAE